MPGCLLVGPRHTEHVTGLAASKKPVVTRVTLASAFTSTCYAAICFDRVTNHNMPLARALETRSTQIIGVCHSPTGFRHHLIPVTVLVPDLRISTCFAAASRNHFVTCVTPCWRAHITPPTCG